MRLTRKAAIAALSAKPEPKVKGAKVATTKTRSLTKECVAAKNLPLDTKVEISRASKEGVVSGEEIFDE